MRPIFKRANKHVNKMMKFFVSLAFLLTVHGSRAEFRIYQKIVGARFRHAQHLITRSLAAETASCAGACLQTADCDAFHCTANSSASFNCELLITSATDYAALTPAADWSIYSSHPLLTSGMATFCCQTEMLVVFIKFWDIAEMSKQKISSPNC